MPITENQGKPGPVIAIVGAGFSGTMVACQLLHSKGTCLEVLLIDRAGSFGQGLAYGTRDPNHLLNVSARAMSAWPNNPNHLVVWLEQNQAELAHLLPAGAEASSYIPREVFGIYLQSILERAAIQAAGQHRLRRITAELSDLEAIEPGSPSAASRYRLQFSNGEPIEADRVVLAWGNSAIPLPLRDHPQQRHGWCADATADLDPEASVALLGTGLTMVDVVVSLRGKGHRGPIVALSRRGHLPNAHLSASVASIGAWLNPEQAPTTLLELWRLIRMRVALAEREGHDWRAVIDGLRPINQKLWQRLSLQERRRFLRHVAVLWDVHRHRVAPQLHEQLQQLINSGALEIIAGRLEAKQSQAKRLQLQIRRRGAASSEYLEVDRLITCTGIRLDYARSTQPLLQRLLQRQQLQADALALGITTTPQGELVAGNGQVVPGVYTLGPPRRGELWESTAVPELRQQAQELANQILISMHV